MILGGSRIAMKTALRLGDSFNIKIIEINRERALEVTSKVSNALVIHGDGRDLELLKSEGIEQMDAEALEFIAKEGSRVTKSIISDLDFPKEATIGGFIRNDQGYIASGKSQINPGDKVVVFTRPIALKKLSNFFN